MLLNVTRSATPRHSLQKHEHCNPGGRCNRTCFDRHPLLLSAKEQNDNKHAVPEPAIASSGRVDCPQTDPPRWPPVIDPAHQAMIASCDVLEHLYVVSLSVYAL